TELYADPRKQWRNGDHLRAGHEDKHGERRQDHHGPQRPAVCMQSAVRLREHPSGPIRSLSCDDSSPELRGMGARLAIPVCLPGGDLAERVDEGRSLTEFGVLDGIATLAVIR